MQYFNGCLSLISGLLYQQYHLCMSCFFQVYSLISPTRSLDYWLFVISFGVSPIIGYVSAVVPSLTCVVLFVRV